MTIHQVRTGEVENGIGILPIDNPAGQRTVRRHRTLTEEGFRAFAEDRAVRAIVLDCAG